MGLSHSSLSFWSILRQIQEVLILNKFSRVCLIIIIIIKYLGYMAKENHL